MFVTCRELTAVLTDMSVRVRMGEMDHVLNAAAAAAVTAAATAGKEVIVEQMVMMGEKTRTGAACMAIAAFLSWSYKSFLPN
jgi:hypothetical protein